MQSIMNSIFLSETTKEALVARPLFKRRLVNKDGTIDCFEIDCLSKHIAKFAEPTAEQRVQLQVLMELKRHLDLLTSQGRTLPTLDGLLRSHPGNVSPAVQSYGSRNSQLRKVPVNSMVKRAQPLPQPQFQPQAQPQAKPKPCPSAANSTQLKAPSNPMVSHLLNRLNESANGAARKTPLGPPKDRGNPLINSASANRKVGLQNAGGSAPLSAALAQHQCAIR